MRNRIKNFCIFSLGSILFFAYGALPAAAQYGGVLDPSKRLSEQNAIQTGQSASKPVPQVIKSETIPAGNWLVTCNDYVNAPVKRACTAKLQILQEKTNAVAFLWEIGLTGDKKVVSIMHFPTGVLIGPGVELRIGKAAPRKFPFTACAQAECTAQFPADLAFIKDVAANPSIEAVTQAINGASLTFTINPAGIDKAFGLIGN